MLVKKTAKTVYRQGQMGRAYSVSLRTSALRDYLNGMRRIDVARKYSLPDASILSLWKRKFAPQEEFKRSFVMVKRRTKRKLQTDMESAQLERIKNLESSLLRVQKALFQKDKDLEDLRIHLRLSETLIDLADEEYNLDIRKNFGSKQ